MLYAGIKGEAHTTVTEQNTAAAMGSGALPVFATPAMVALMEKAAADSVAPLIEEGKGTVGTLINVKHLAATPLNGKIRAESSLTEVDGKRLAFTVKAFDGAGLIGEGEHERFIIDNERFMEKTNNRA